MIDIQRVLKDVPHLDTFCSVETLHRLAEKLRSDKRFEVNIAGASVNQVPIHHIRFGKGSTKALFVGFNHCPEAMTGLTIFSLLSLLSQGHQELVKQDVEWHFVPVIDPDGALLNEGWTQKPFTFANYMRNFYLQPTLDQVDITFPVRHKKMVWDKPSHEASVLKAVIDKVRPDYYLPGHDSRPANGSWWFISRDIGSKYYQQLRELLEQAQMPFIVNSDFEGYTSFGPGVYEMRSAISYYDEYEKIDPSMIENVFTKSGTMSMDYVREVNPEVLVLGGEFTNIRYLGGDLKGESERTRRQSLLRVSADDKFLASVLLEEWEKVKGDVDTASPFYRKVMTEFIANKDKLHEGLFHWQEVQTLTLLSDPRYGRKATEGDRINAQAAFSWGRFGFLCHAYSVVRLLNGSKQTPAVREAIERLEKLFDEALEEIDAEVDFGKFEAIDCSTLAKAYTGSGLIALNAVLEKRR